MSAGRRELMRKATLEELTLLVGGRLEGDASLEIRGMASPEEAGQGEITFLAEVKSITRLEKTRASAVIVPSSLPSCPKPIIITPNPYLAYAKIQAFFSHQPYFSKGIDSRSHIGQGVKIGREVSIFPFVFIGDGSQIGDRVVLYPGVYLGESVQVGEGTILYPNVCVMDRCIIGKRVTIHPGAVIGSDGFGYARDGSQYVKIPQVGIVQVDDEAEIGANCTVDRAAMGKTWIKRGVKADNLVQIGHNVTVGEDTILVAQVGIAGSTVVGSRVALGGQVGVAGHIAIGDGVRVGGQSGVTQTVAPGRVISGTPAFPHREWLKAQAVFQKLPEMKQRLVALEKQLKNLEEAVRSQRFAFSEKTKK